jgi:hypothetical protein
VGPLRSCHDSFLSFAPCEALEMHKAPQKTNTEMVAFSALFEAEFLLYLPNPKLLLYVLFLAVCFHSCEFLLVRLRNFFPCFNQSSSFLFQEGLPCYP